FVAHVRGPMALRIARLAEDVGVVVAGDHGHVAWVADLCEPGTGLRKFGREREIDEVAGDRDVVDSARLEIGDDPVERRPQMKVPAVVLPVHVAEQSFARELVRSRRGHRRKMWVGEVRQNESRHSTNPMESRYSSWKSRTADENARKKDQDAAEHDLERC